jgi:flavin-binding protein dodecin
MSAGGAVWLRGVGSILRREVAQSMAVVNVIELVADSEQSWEDAVKHAVAEAARTVRGITGVEVVNFTATVDEGHIKSYRANVNVAFLVEAGARA